MELRKLKEMKTRELGEDDTKDESVHLIFIHAHYVLV